MTTNSRRRKRRKISPKDSDSVARVNSSSSLVQAVSTKAQGKQETDESRSWDASPATTFPATLPPSHEALDAQARPDLGTAGFGSASPKDERRLMVSPISGSPAERDGKHEAATAAASLVRIVKVKPQMVLKIRYNRRSGSCDGASRRDSASAPITAATECLPSKDLAPAKKSVHPFFLGKPSQPLNSSSATPGRGFKADLDTSVISNNISQSNPDRSKRHIFQEATSAAGGPDQRKSTFTPPKAGDKAFRIISGARTTRQLGGTSPPWPPREMFHVRGISTEGLSPGGGQCPPRGDQRLPLSKKKQKHSPATVSEDENLLRRIQGQLVHSLGGRTISDALPSYGADESALDLVPKELRLPERLVLRSNELQRLVLNRIFEPHVDR
ncbi:MAG: hypothetical protein M1815_002508 [Lichina confinis]|nr:MAG: hypothetical protein M1815_002508 [Lichina confinis]